MFFRITIILLLLVFSLGRAKAETEVGCGTFTSYVGPEGVQYDDDNSTLCYVEKSFDNGVSASATIYSDFDSETDAGNEVDYNLSVTKTVGGIDATVTMSYYALTGPDAANASLALQKVWDVGFTEVTTYASAERNFNTEDDSHDEGNFYTLGTSVSAPVSDKVTGTVDFAVIKDDGYFGSPRGESVKLSLFADYQVTDTLSAGVEATQFRSLSERFERPDNGYLGVYFTIAV